MGKRKKVYGIASVGMVPVRHTSSDMSEMVSQLLMGELFTVEDEQNNAYRIKAYFDGYPGWINKNECCLLQSNERQHWQQIQNDPSKRSPYFTFRIQNSSFAAIVPAGAVGDFDDNVMMYPFGRFSIRQSRNKLRGDTVLDTAKAFLGTPYLWGGRTDTGIDCSGFIQTVLILHGFRFPRDSSEQAKAARLYDINFSGMEPGDIIYFKPENRKITHVGFYLGEGMLLHASGCVKIQYIGTETNSKLKDIKNEKLAACMAGFQRLSEIMNKEQFKF